MAKPYIPLLENNTGHLYLYNDPNSAVFNFPQFNGNNVDKPSVASAAFGLSGDNTNWQGRLGLTFDPAALAGVGAFELTYNGSVFDPHVAATQLAIQSDDLAWFNAPNKTYDVFSPSVSGGGNLFNIEIDYMIQPAVSSVSPLTVVASSPAPGPATPQNGSSAIPTNSTVNASDWESVSGSGQWRTTSGATSFAHTLSVVYAHNFGFSVPAGATILGVVANLGMVSQSTTGATLSSISLFSQGVAIGTAKNPGTQFAPVPVQNNSYGSGSDLWGAPLTAAIVNDPSFGFGLTVTVQNIRVFLQTFTMTVLYQVGSSAPQNQTFTISLAKPISPQQTGANSTGNTVTPTVTMDGGVTVSSVTPVLDAQGWTTGYTVQAQVPNLVSTNGQSNMFLTLQGNLTYLTGDSFVTQNVVYINHVQIATITLQNNTATAPVEYSFVVNPAGPQLTGSVTLTAQTYSARDNVNNCVFNQQPSGTSNRVALGTGTKTGSQPGTINGQSVFISTFQLTFTASTTTLPVGNHDLGFVATDTNSLSVTFWDSIQYFNSQPVSGGGGGGGTGCLTEHVTVETPEGPVEFGACPRDEQFLIVNTTGTHKAVLVVHENYSDDFVELAPDKYITVGHKLKHKDDSTWLTADEFYPESYRRVRLENVTVFDISVITDEDDSRHVIIEGSDIAHNVILAEKVA